MKKEQIIGNWNKKKNQHFNSIKKHEILGEIFNRMYTIIICCLVTKLYPMDCRPPGSSVHGISQAKILEQVFPSPGDLPDPEIEPTSPTLAGRFFTTKPPGKPDKGLMSYIKNPYNSPVWEQTPFF